jgi:hypothetical protein
VEFLGNTERAPQPSWSSCAAAKSDSSFKLVDTYVATRRFDDVVKSLQQNVQESFDQDMTTRRSQGGITTVTFIVPSKGRLVASTLPQDIDRLTPSTTKLSYYGSTSSGGKEKP